MAEPTDREILIRLDERTIGMADDIKEMRADYKGLDHRIRDVETKVASVADHEVRLRAVEDKTKEAAGFLKGVNWVKGIALALPAGVIGWFASQIK